MSIFRRYLRLAGLFSLIFILLLHVYVYAPVLTKSEDEYIERKGQVKSKVVTKKWRHEDNTFTELSITSTSGLQVELQIREPVMHSGHYPVVLLLGGIGTGRNACKIIPPVEHLICAALSYPYQGDEEIRGIGYLTNLRYVQQTIADTPAAAMLVMEYLSVKYPGSRMELIGVSFGAYFASIPAVLDTRVSRLWLVQGGAEPHKVLGHNMLKSVKTRWIKTLSGVYVGEALGARHVDPEKWVVRFSPRPVILVNTIDDKTFPASSVSALHESAKQPKEIIWLKGEHVRPYREEVIEQLSNIVINRIEREYKERIPAP